MRTLRKIKNTMKNKKTTKQTTKSRVEKQGSMQSSIAPSATKIIPMGSRVLIRPFTKEELQKKNTFGIILPGNDSREKSEQGTVLAVGPGEYRDGKLVPPQVKTGDRVCYSKYGYDDVTVGGEEFYLIKEENILAVLK